MGPRLNCLCVTFVHSKVAENKQWLDLLYCVHWFSPDMVTNMISILIMWTNSLKPLYFLASS